MNEDKSKSDVETKPSSAITSSSESETFETWTLVTPELMDKKKKSNVHETKVLDFGDDRQHIEVLKRDDTHTDGEMSDGISIISDSESGGRASPQPSPRRLSLPNRGSTTPKNNVSENEEEDLNNKDEKNDRPITPPSTPEAIDLSSQSIREDLLLQQQTATAEQRINEINAAEREDDDNQAFTMQLRWTSITSISKAFYLAALVAAIAIFGCMRAPPQQPATETGDLNAIYAKLNDILMTTGRLEELVHATLSEINDNDAISPYTDVLTTVREMNSKFDANNRALRDVLNRIEQLPEKYATLLTVVEPEDIEKPIKFESGEKFKEKYQEKYQQVKNDELKKRQYEKSTKLEDRPKKFDDAQKDNWPKREDRERPKSRFDENKKPNEYNKEKDYKRNDFKNNDGSYRQQHKSDNNAKLRGNGEYKDREKQRKNAYNERQKSASSNEEHEKPQKPYDKPYKGDYKDRESHYKDDHGGKDEYRKNDDYKTTKGERIEKNDNKKFDESEDDWMERRSRYREDSRKDSDRRKMNDESANWYLERGSGRQKARKPVEA